MANAMLEYLCRQGLGYWIKSDDDVSIYEIGYIWVSVQNKTDPFNQRVRAIGMNEKNEATGEHLPFKPELLPFNQREGWHFAEIGCLEFGAITVHFQYMLASYVVRCVVCEHGNEISSTDYECWTDIERFLSEL